MRRLIVVDQFDSGNNGTTISAQRFARALRDAAAIDPRVKGVPSTKGVL